MTNKPIQELHTNLLMADSNWSLALRIAFGSAAGDRRYDSDKSTHPAACRQALAKKKEAEKAFEAAGGWELWRKGDPERHNDACAPWMEELFS